MVFRNTQRPRISYERELKTPIELFFTHYVFHLDGREVRRAPGASVANLPQIVTRTKPPPDALMAQFMRPSMLLVILTKCLGDTRATRLGHPDVYVLVRWRIRHRAGGYYFRWNGSILHSLVLTS